MRHFLLKIKIYLSIYLSNFTQNFEIFVPGEQIFRGSKYHVTGLHEPHQALSNAFMSSGVAKLGHTGARALTTGGCAPPVQALLKIFGAECQSRIGRLKCAKVLKSSCVV